MSGTAVLRMVVSSASMKKATATSQAGAASRHRSTFEAHACGAPVNARARRRRGLRVAQILARCALSKKLSA